MNAVIRKIQTIFFKFSKNKLCDTGYFARIQKDIAQIPDSNGQRYYIPYPVSIAIAADEFLYRSFCHTADFQYVTPDNYRQVCEETQVLLIVSAWRGLYNEWRFMGTKGSRANQAVYEVIDYFRDKGKTILFYSKEDPPNYSHFLPIAKHCDIIFTSAEEKIEDYKRDCGNENVYLMQFCVQPLYHNPIGCRIRKRKNEVIFSGSWVKKYPDRIRQQRMIFDGVLDAGKKLKIIDRNFELDNWAFLFPLKYARYLSPSIGHANLQKVHKLYDWAVNVNSVSDSRTMFANRVYELQAEGNLLISNESTGIREQFEEVKIVCSRQEVKRALNAYNDEEIYEHQIAGIRRVMRDETAFERVGGMLCAAGYEVCQPVRKIAVFAEKITQQLLDDFNQQTYPHKTLLEITGSMKAELKKYDMAAIWDTDSRYGKFYLEDMICAFKYTNSDYIAKDCFLENGKLCRGLEHNYIHAIKNIHAAVFWTASIDVCKIMEQAKKESIVYAANGYSIDHFHYRRN